MVLALDLLDVLRCPYCVRGDTGRLRYDAGRLSTVRSDMWLVCQESDCGRKLPIKAGIPVMLIEQGTKWGEVNASDLPDPETIRNAKDTPSCRKQLEHRGSGSDKPLSDQQSLSLLLGLAERLKEAIRVRHEEQIPSCGDAHRDPKSIHEFDQQRFRLLSRLIDRLMTETSPRTAIDIGVGLGVITARLKSSGVCVTSLDLNMDYLLSVRQREPHSILIQGDCTNLPFMDASFDLVVATDVIEHVLLYEQALCECGCVAKRGFVFPTSLNGLHRVFAQSVGYDVRAEDASFGHLHVYSHSKLMRLLSANLEGFRFSRPYCLFVTPVFLSIPTLNYRLPAAWTRPLLRLPNWLATRFPPVFGNWIAVAATRPGTQLPKNEAR